MSLVSTVQGYLSHEFHYQYLDEVRRNALTSNEAVVFKELDEKELGALNETLDEKVRKWEWIDAGKVRNNFDQVRDYLIISLTLTVALPILFAVGSTKLAVVAITALISYGIAYYNHRQVAIVDQQVADEMVLKAQVLFRQRVTLDLYSKVKRAFKDYLCTSKDPNEHQAVIEAVYESRKKAAVTFFNERLKEEIKVDLAKLNPKEFLQFAFDFYLGNNRFPSQKAIIIEFTDAIIGRDFGTAEIDQEFVRVLTEKGIYRKGSEPPAGFSSLSTRLASTVVVRV